MGQRHETINCGSQQFKNQGQTRLKTDLKDIGSSRFLTLLEVSRRICRLGWRVYWHICHPNLYGYRDTCVIWVIYTRNPLFRARVKFFLPPKGLSFCLSCPWNLITANKHINWRRMDRRLQKPTCNYILTFKMQYNTVYSWTWRLECAHD